MSIQTQGALERARRTSARAPEGSRPVRGGGLRVAIAAGALTALLAGVVCALILGGGHVGLGVVGVIVMLAVALAAGWRLGDHRRAELEAEIGRRAGELDRALTELEIAQAETVRRLSMAVEFRDEDTGAHIERIGRFSTQLAQRMGMDSEFCERLSHAAPLHDVGKVAIPDAILLKPGPLTAEERAIVETHAEEGYRLLRGSSSSILDLASTVALSHHERWDGTGYPRGASGESIPIEGRIVAIADVFDALTSDRVYRKAFPVENAIEMMRSERGRHFDPALLDVFMEIVASSRPDAQTSSGSDARERVARTLETYANAIERGDPEQAEGVIATAIEEGIEPRTLHSDVIAPALRRVDDLWESGEMNVEAEQLATGITRRVLATLYRYMLGATVPHRERVLLGAVEGDSHTLVLQMVHDQLAAAGFETSLQTDLSPERLEATIETHSPDMIVLGGTLATVAEPLERMLTALGERHPGLSVVVGGEVVQRLQRRHTGVRVVRRLDQAAEVVEELLAARAQSEREPSPAGSVSSGR